MVVFLRERKFESVDELVEAGERYRIAHPGKSIARKSVTSLWGGSGAASANACLANGPWRDNKSYRVNSRIGYRGSPYSSASRDANRGGYQRGGALMFLLTVVCRNSREVLAASQPWAGH